MIAFIASLFLRMLRVTWRVRLTGPDPPFDAGPLVFVFWHGRQSGLLAHPRPRKVAVMSSLSRDGSLQARILRRLGFDVVRGSSSRGGAAGLKGLLARMAKGCDGAFAVDGPRGPAGVVKPGAGASARTAGALLVPLTFVSSSEWIFESAWDRYALPKPFARVEIRRSEPLPADIDDGALAAALERLSQPDCPRH